MTAPLYLRSNRRPIQQLLLLLCSAPRPLRHIRLHLPLRLLQIIIRILRVALIDWHRLRPRNLVERLDDIVLVLVLALDGLLAVCCGRTGSALAPVCGRERPTKLDHQRGATANALVLYYIHLNGGVVELQPGEVLPPELAGYVG